MTWRHASTNSEGILAVGLSLMCAASLGFVLLVPKRLLGGMPETDNPTLLAKRSEDYGASQPSRVNQKE